MSVAKRNKEEELVEHLLSSDQNRFAHIYDYFSEDIYGIIFKIVEQEKIAEDILQEVFIKVWNGARTYDPARARLFTWILNIARNSAIDYLRSKQGQIDKKRESMDNFDQGDSPDLAIEPNESGIVQIIHSLKKEQLEVINLGFFEGYTQAEIAVKLNIPLGTVKTRCRTALQSLRQKYIHEF